MVGLHEYTFDQQIYGEYTLNVASSRGPVPRSLFHQFAGTLPDNGFCGLAARYNKKNRITKIAFASSTYVLILNEIPKAKRHRQPLVAFLTGDIRKHALDMLRPALALHAKHGISIANAVDMLSQQLDVRNADETFLSAVGGSNYHQTINVDNARRLMGRLDRPQPMSEAKAEIDLALEAWVAFQGANNFLADGNSTSMDTRWLSSQVLDVFSKAYFDQLSLDALKPIRMKNEVEVSREKGEVKAVSQRYKTKLRKLGQKQHLELLSVANDGTRLTSRAKFSGKLDGRKARIATGLTGVVLTITTVGREDPTSAAAQKLNLTLTTLCNDTSITSNPYFCRIFGTGVARFPPSTRRTIACSNNFTERPLNPSQCQAVDTILSNSPETRCVLIHGPPGTGKTTVIAAAAMAGVRSDPKRTVWLVAQSNVAVKNIAEKLASLNFTQFRILVSQDFHYDWHEHIYECIKDKLIRSEKIFPDDTVMARRLAGARIILCTISMLSSDRLDAVLRIVPVDTLIVDEASQIEVGSYLHPIHRCARSLNKIVFIGDDKQLPPFGDSDIKDLQSIFEKPHLRSSAVFLDTQYRMPKPLGRFISKNVYENKLKSVHDIVTPCCLFVNTVGTEEQKGHSWINTGEAATVCQLAKQLQRRNRAFKVITPYDPQRGLLERALKDSGLQWENKCFNVDSFQGNEEDYIIISVVRTNKLGFLNDERRMNVMLTRCKKGMFICSSRGFLDGPAKSTLVGKLAREVGDAGWTTANRVLNGDLSFLA